MTELHRRTFLRMLVGGPVVAPQMFARSSVQYSISLRPSHALLGDRVVATLSCHASNDAETFTFEDSSLMLELKRRPVDPDPARSFPNHGDGARVGNRQIRFASPSRKHLRSGERLVRDFDLLAVDPDWVLDTGDFDVSYQIGPDDQSWRAGPARLTIESGPAAIAGLFALLEGGDVAVRARACGLLHRMTGHVAGYGVEAGAKERNEALERWHRWWDQTGESLPWNFGSVGATYGKAAIAPPQCGRSKVLGGIAYGRVPLEPTGGTAISRALTNWLQGSSKAETLEGRRWIADRVFLYPSGETTLDLGEEVTRLVEAVLVRLAQLARTASADSIGAPIILATVARALSVRFVSSLSSIRDAAMGSASWQQSIFMMDGLLDILDPSRVPVGGH